MRTHNPFPRTKPLATLARLSEAATADEWYDEISALSWLDDSPGGNS